MKPVSACILTIGNELLFGETIDTNAAFIAQQLTAAGVKIARKATLPDTIATIAQVVKNQEEDICIITGGLGPTDDDLTRQALARAFNTRLFPNQRQAKRIEAFFKRFKRPMAQSNYVQALVPQGFAALDNDFGTAPMLFRKKPFICVLPGVPREARNLMTSAVLPLVQSHFRLTPIVHKEIKTTGIGESSLFDRIKDIAVPASITLAYLPEISGVVVRLSGRNTKAIVPLRNKIRARLREYIYGRRGDTLESVIQRIFIRKKLTLALAESCTGGLIASKLVAVPGSSRYFLGSVVCYSNALKIKMAGVPKRVIQRYGAVSEETALAMTQGIRRKTGAGVALSVTGIAGPGGGTKKKPVGTVCIACVSGHKRIVEKIQLFGGRSAIQERAAYTALNFIRKSVQ
ncbi:MAG: hypothetical protein A2268_05285 [Candidatus Raymondbacteria bacterium RifOxyA12_full_50_37]|uniref:CinA-like protein n=1 Tax=Candidatus Raymondbacteria bacterium RIFOXYD12_FULL_49_13 TaxID=1817890 RepID=A0A1F7FC10_UNCRA|nr:MAG: hypothetical protein A2268_05285 [Candidatus Raymondbacteria bacterium RifOxyA12_full_50_37]OGJ88980.1 MAG: hypothetical protein A2248_02520 [Candidatus Raymondbacteria bacterium RIFOXYA2_FULL_49_16]OGJ97008.1 MAG: hypothetical protein A2453_03940 [Candidatus Raymondbacteria bacterium RIFOXYC2_FULL_50_21]OGK02553.1 MAG: hypothetical protein A2487_15010 [Candidatus Raymondbacteria bacterium RifOxyC12_full_50_8]OGK04006.1 MAG: hypothetical protein A2519_00680 [Candidatus Raymondbacteria b